MYIICVNIYIYIYVYLYMYIFLCKHINIYLYLDPCNTGVLAALGPVVPGILRTCSGYAGFWPWLLAAALRRQENAKTRVDRRSTRDFALYRRFGRAGNLVHCDLVLSWDWVFCTLGSVVACSVTYYLNNVGRQKGKMTMLNGQCALVPYSHLSLKGQMFSNITHKGGWGCSLALFLNGYCQSCKMRYAQRS